MPSSRACRTHARAASSSTCEPWVSQLPYAISEILSPLLPRLRVSMGPTLCRPWARPTRGTVVSEPRDSRLRAARSVGVGQLRPQLDLGLGQSQPPKLDRAEHGVADGALGGTVLAPVETTPQLTAEPVD